MATHLPGGGALPRPRGRPRTGARLAPGAPPATTVAAVVASWPAEPWQRFAVAEGEQRPRLYDWGRARVIEPRDRLPGPEVWLLGVPIGIRIGAPHRSKLRWGPLDGVPTLRTRRNEWLAAGVFQELERIVLESDDAMTGLELADLARRPHQGPLRWRGRGPKPGRSGQAASSAPP